MHTYKYFLNNRLTLTFQNEALSYKGLFMRINTNMEMTVIVRSFTERSRPR